MKITRTGGLMPHILLAITLLLPYQAGAASGEEPRFKTKRTAAMSDRVFKQLAEARDIADAGDHAEALRLLDQVRTRGDLNGYESGMAWNFTAYVYYAQQRYDDAIGAYRKILGYSGIPESLEQSTLYSLAQMYFVTDRYQEALAPLQRWMANQENPGPNAYVMLAQAHYQLGDLASAREAADSAVSLAEATPEGARKNWYLLQRAIYYGQKDYPALLGVLKKLVRSYPEGDYWVQLAAVYGELGREGEQLATLEAAYEAGFLTKPRDHVTLAQLMLGAGVPYKAARVLEQALDDGVIEEDLENLRLLADAWTLAQESDGAVKALLAASEYAEDGRIDARLAQIEMERQEWSRAAAAAEKAIARGGLDRPGMIYVIHGLALYNMDMIGESTAAFSRAKDDAESAEIAEQWLAYIERDTERRRRLNLGS